MNRLLAAAFSILLLTGAGFAQIPTRVNLPAQTGGRLPVSRLGDAAGVSTPTTGTLTTSTTGGTLLDATTYYYRVSATTASGETLASTEVSKLTGSGGNTNTVTIPWGQVDLATGYKVYCRSTGAELLCATITDPTTLSWTDDGSVTPSGALPTRDTSGNVLSSLGAYQLLLNSSPTSQASLFNYDFESSLSSLTSTLYYNFLSRATGDAPAGATLYGGSAGLNFFSPTSGTNSYTGLEGFFEPHTHNSAAAVVSTGYALSGTVQLNADGTSSTLTCTTCASLQGSTFLSTGATASNWYGLLLSLSNAGSITNAWGINIPAMAGTSNAHGIQVGDVTNSGGPAYAWYSGLGLARFGDELDGTVINASTGFRIASTATTGRYPRGNGTNFVQSSVAAAGAGACTNQVVTSNNDNAVPTCSTVSSSVMAAANKTIEKSVVILSPTTSNTNQVQWYYGQAVTLTRVACSTDTGTVTIQLDKRAEATPNTAGTNALTSSLSCTTTTGTTTSFSSAGVSADIPLNLQITATSGTPGVVRIHADATIN